MHTNEITPEMFHVAIDGQAAGIEAVFPDWDRYDRFGIVIHEGWGAIGASLLIQATIAEFFRARRAAGVGDIYPEIYAIHVGRDFGDLSVYDFWPFYKEVVVESDPEKVLHTINNLGITRLLVPAGESAPVDFVWPEKIAIKDRVKTVIEYSADGHTEGADIEIRSDAPLVEQQTAETFDIKTAIEKYKDSDLVDNKRWLQHARRRLESVTEEETQRAMARHKAKERDGVVVETYRKVNLKHAMTRFVPEPATATV